MQKVKATILSEESIERFRTALSGRGKSPHTMKAYCTDLKVFMRALGTDTPVSLEEEFEELGEAWLTKYRRTLAPRTTERRLTSLKAFASWAGYPTLFSEYSTPSAAPPMPHPLPEGMDGVRRLLAATENERQRALIALCGFAGLRMAEALSVKYSHFSFQNKANPILTVMGKGEKVRRVPISQEAFGYLAVPLARAMGTDVPVVPLKDRFARRVITDLGVKAGLERPISSHDLRATFATAVYNRTKDQRLVQMLLGHSSGKTTEGYIGVQMEQMTEGVELL